MNCFIRFSTVFLLWALSLTSAMADTVLTAVVNAGTESEKAVTFTAEELLAIGSHTLTTGNDYVEGKGSVYKSYAWICDRGGEASAG